jgi:hypothetical protein
MLTLEPLEPRNLLDAASWVGHLYATELGRPAEPAGLAYWTATTAAFGRAWTEAGIRLSQEGRLHTVDCWSMDFKIGGPTGDAVVLTPAERQGFADRVLSIGEERARLEWFMGDGYWRQLRDSYAAEGVPLQEAQHRLSYTVSASQYQRIGWDQFPDVDELRRDFDAIYFGTQTWASVVERNLDSPQIRERAVREAYHDLLGRDADAAGLAYWLHFQGPTAKRGISLSDEAYNRA